MCLNDCFKSFDLYLKATGCAKATLEAYRRTLCKFEKYLDCSDLSSQAEQLMKEDVIGFLGACEDLGEKRASVIHRLLVLKKFFGWMKGERIIAENPIAEIPVPKETKRVPRFVSPQQIESLLNQPDVAKPCGLRDRALMEVLYSAGLRISEALGIQIEDIDWQVGFVYIRQGKGGNPRNVPIGKTALVWLQTYLLEGRRKMETDCSLLAFLSCSGKTLSRQSAAKAIRAYARLAGLPEWFTPHSLRHACATHMLQGGAGLAHIQDLLGHARAESTRIYTLVRSEDLKSVHASCHPRA